MRNANGSLEIHGYLERVTVDTGIALARLVNRNKTLTSLDLSYHDFPEQVCVALARALQWNKTIKKISLASNLFVSYQCGLALAKMLCENSTIEELNLSGNDFCAAACRRLAAGLKSNSTLTALHVSARQSQPLPVDGIVEILIALGSSVTIKTLDLADQWIGGWAGSYLADLLRDNTTLTSLELFGTDWMEATFFELLQVLRDNSALTCLSLTMNNAGKYPDAVNEMLRCNVTLKELYLECAASALSCSSFSCFLESAT